MCSGKLEHLRSLHVRIVVGLLVHLSWVNFEKKTLWKHSLVQWTSLDYIIAAVTYQWRRNVSDDGTPKPTMETSTESRRLKIEQDARNVRNAK